MIKAILFDFDGTLLDSFHECYLTYNKCAEFFGKPPYSTPEAYRKSSLQGFEKLYVANGFKDPEGVQAFWKKHYHYDHLDVYPEVIPLIKHLSQKVPLAIISSNFTANIERALERAGIRDCFQTIVSREDVKEKKPHPEGLSLCLSRLNVSKEEVLYIGDMIEDILFAEVSHVPFVMVSYGYHPHDVLEKAGAKIIFTTSAELFSYLEKQLH